MSSSLTEISTYFLQPTIIAAAASLGIHGLLGLSLPAISAASKQAEQNQKGNVKVVELTPEELSRVPPLSSTPNTPYVPYGQPSQSLPPASLYSPPPSTFPFPANPSDSDLVGGTLPQTRRYKLPRPSVSEKASNKPNTRTKKQTSTSSGYSTEGSQISGSGSGNNRQKRNNSDRQANGTSDVGSDEPKINNSPSSIEKLSARITPGKNEEIDKLVTKAGQPGSQNQTSGNNPSGQNPASGGNPGQPSLGNNPRPSSPQRYVHNPSNTSSEAATSNYQSWLAKAQNSNPDLVVKLPIYKSIDYPQGVSCLPVEPKAAILSVMVDQNSNVVGSPELIGSTGYDELNQKALEIVRASVPEAIQQYRKNDDDKGKPQVYQFRVTVKSCPVRSLWDNRTLAVLPVALRSL